MTRKNQLRSVPAADKPKWIGGSAEKQQVMAPMKAELFDKAGMLHKQLRPKIEHLNQQRALNRNELETEIKQLCTEHDTITAILSKTSPMRPKYELDRIVAERPGWLQLQSELRQNVSCTLNPVVYDGFYVIRSVQLPL